MCVCVCVCVCVSDSPENNGIFENKMILFGWPFPLEKT